MKTLIAKNNWTKRIWQVAWSLICASLWLACASGPGAQANSPAARALDSVIETTSTLVSEAPLSYAFPFRLDEPNRSFKLPYALVEVSGLSYVEKDLIAMVQDEQAKIFLFDLAGDSVSSTHRFGNHGDFEGVEIVGQTAFVLRSDGDVYRILNYRASKSPSATKFENALKVSDDAEGLGYDASQNRLLIACKEAPEINGRELDQQRAIYAFDIQKPQLLPSPFLLVDMKAIKQFMKKHAQTNKEKERADDFDPKKNGDFKPSGVAIHPLTGNIYIISSSGRILVVVNAQREIIQVRHLDKEIFPQPEGICFSPGGDLFISNEGQGKRATLLEFKARGNE